MASRDRDNIDNPPEAHHNWSPVTEAEEFLRLISHPLSQQNVASPAHRGSEGAQDGDRVHDACVAGSAAPPPPPPRRATPGGSIPCRV
jgi:hypothetical protein